MHSGLRYYIRKNVEPAKRAELRLVVNAGSILEDDDQRGYAHFLEHTAFNGTRHFKKNDLIKYLQSIGVQFGADLNAYSLPTRQSFARQMIGQGLELARRGFRQEEARADTRP